MRFRKASFRNLGIKESLFALFAVLSALHYVVGSLSFAPLVEISHNLTSFRTDNLRAVSYLNQAERAFLKLSRGPTNISLDNDWTLQINEGMSKYKPLADTESERQGMEKWNEAYLEYSKNRHHFFDLLKAKRILQAKIYETREILPFSKAAEEALEGLIAFQSQVVAEKELKVDTDIKKSKFIIALVTIFSSLIGGFITFLSVNWISKSQEQRLQALGKISSFGDIARNINHEIRTPLTVIQLTSEEIREASKLGQINQSFLEKHLGKIEDNISRMGKIVSGLKDFSRAGNSEPFISVELKSLVEDALLFCRYKMSRHSIKFILDLPADPLSVQGRSIELSQVLVTLIGNAIEAVQELDEKWIGVSILDHSEFLEVSITDSGTGIPKAIREKMFKTPVTTKPVGTGVGLITVHKIISAHNGTIIVDEKCKNTRFSIRLPKAQSFIKVLAA